MYEWDESKNKSNFEKHGITFKEAAEIFKYPIMTAIDDRYDYGEQRKISIGTIGAHAIILVIHTDRNGNIRLISARRANYKERQRYNDYIKKTFK